MSKTNNNDIFRFSLYGNPDKKFDKLEATYCPIKYEKYITICVDNGYQYWGEAIELCIPFLQKEDIYIVCVSIGENAQQNVPLNINGINIRHAAYLFENSLCHFSGQDWSLSLCQNNEVKERVFVATGSKENLFMKEYHDFIEDTTKPELVAQKILDKLKIKKKILVKTAKIGPSYGPHVIELVPDFKITGRPNVSEDTHIGVRCDLVENWGFVLELLRMGIKPFVMSKTVPPLPLASFLSGIKGLNLYVGDDVDLEAIDRAERCGLKVKIIVGENQSEKSKRNLFDFDNIHEIKNWGKNNLDFFDSLNYDTKIKSHKLLVGRGKTYISVYHWKHDIPVTEPKGNLLLDAPEDEDFLMESDLFYYYNT